MCCEIDSSVHNTGRLAERNKKMPTITVKCRSNNEYGHLNVLLMI